MPSCRSPIVAPSVRSTSIRQSGGRLAIVLLAASLTIGGTACKGKKSADAVAAASVLEAPSLGAAQPKVDILAFVDYECPFCRGQAKTLSAAITQHAADVRLRFFNLPLDVHPNSVIGAKGAVAAAQLGVFQKYYDNFTADTPMSREAILAWGKQAGVDEKKLIAAMDSPETEKIVKRDVALAKALGVVGTPSFIINGALVQGVQSAQVWEKRIVDEAKRADGVIATGAKREDLQKALVAITNPKGAKDYEKYVLEGQPAPEQPVPAKVPRASGVASATIAPAGGGSAAMQVGEPVQVNPETSDTTTVWRVAVRADDPSMGPATAGATIVVFEDMECPFCAKLRPTLHKLREANPTSVRIVFKHNPLPFHKNANSAAEALEAARQQGKFWEMHDFLLQNQEKLDDAGLKAAAEKVGLNRAQFDTALAAHGGRDRIEADVEQAAALGARGTPNLFINGRKLVGAKEEAVIKQMIDEEVAHAQQLVTAGTPKDGVYEAIVSKGKLLDSLASEEKKIDVTGAATRGNAGAAIQIVTFQDFQCPFSARLDPHLAEIEKEFEGRVQIIWLDFPLREIHPMAETFAQAGHEALKQGKFWQFHSAIMSDNGKLDDAMLLARAKKAGLNVKALQDALTAKTWAGEVEKQRKVGESLGVRGTPTVFINGHQFVPQSGFSASTFRTAVRRLLGTR